MKRIILVLLSIVLFSISAVAQTRDHADKAIVYVYSYAAGVTLGRVKKPVYVGETELADIRPAKYFIVLLDPGKHAFHLRNKKFGGIEQEFKAGEIYYVRVVWSMDAALKPGGFVLMTRENGEYDIKQLKPIDKGNIRDKSMVITALD